MPMPSWSGCGPKLRKFRRVQSWCVPRVRRHPSHASVGASRSLVVDGRAPIRPSSCFGIHRQCQSGRGDDQTGRGRETFGRDPVSRVQDARYGLRDIRLGAASNPGPKSRSRSPVRSAAATMEFDLTRLDSDDDPLVPPSSATQGAIPALPTWVDSPPEQTSHGVVVLARSVARSRFKGNCGDQESVQPMGGRRRCYSWWHSGCNQWFGH